MEHDLNMAFRNFAEQKLQEHTEQLNAKIKGNDPFNDLERRKYMMGQIELLTKELDEENNSLSHSDPELKEELNQLSSFYISQFESQYA